MGKKNLYIGHDDFPVDKKDANIIKRLRLESESSKKAWYELTLTQITVGYLIEKTSGIPGHTLHSETWFRKELSEAEKKFDGIISDKTNPNRKSPRKYHIVCFGENL